jgi:hypothetical protein
MSTILEHALSYAAGGLEIFPAPPGEKKSYYSKEYSAEGKRWGATKNPDTIRQYWTEHPEANIGIPTGKDNSFWVLEFDTMVGHSVDGAASMAALEAEFGPLPATLQAESPSGSVHYYFQCPEFKIVGTPGIRPGIDIRADGNMVLAPPSIKPGVGAYKWRNNLPIAEAPPWLLDLVKTAKTSAAAVERAPVNIPPLHPDASDVEKALHTEYHKVARAPEGTRNHHLNRSSFELGRFVGAGELDDEQAIQTLVNACDANGSLAENAGECRGTIDSGMRAGKADPAKTVKTMFGGVAQFAAAARQNGAQPVAGGTGQVIPFELPPGTRGPLTADEMEPVEYDPPAGYMQLLDDRLKNFVLPDYLWDEILMKRFCYSMTAQTGTGKTAIALLLAAHVATGRTLCGLDVEKGEVIYLAGENPIDVDMRFFGLCQVMGLDPSALKIAILPFAGPLSKYADAIREECESRSVRPALVIVDTAAAYFEGKDGNTN